ncbi:hypothetical protein GCM10010360_24760 [Streptomyces nogalater]
MNMPFGVPAPVTYEVQRLRPEPGDRLVLITDGMHERAAAAVDLLSLVVATRDEHPREMVPPDPSGPAGARLPHAGGRTDSAWRNSSRGSQRALTRCRRA